MALNKTPSSLHYSHTLASPSSLGVASSLLRDTSVGRYTRTETRPLGGARRAGRDGARGAGRGGGHTARLSIIYFSSFRTFHRVEMELNLN
ncbi:hypothetical protein EVAR_46589_1 [Eumeta japonica]|uniref:Uncharacterized protein n=1 Tax=Eumeta variegata TaxID=151549 RepID=A0A4C1WS00_EUMVA|nr:hypothetical protein EVAR_46589_1 [Eumeta japonica]